MLLFDISFLFFSFFLPAVSGTVICYDRKDWWDQHWTFYLENFKFSISTQKIILEVIFAFVLESRPRKFQMGSFCLVLYTVAYGGCVYHKGIILVANMTIAAWLGQWLKQYIY